MISGIVTLALALGATAQTQNNRISDSDPFKDEQIWLLMSKENNWAWINPGPCDNDVTAIACRSFKNDGDFTVEQSQNSGVDQVYDIKTFLPYNKALMAVSTGPWDKLATGPADKGFGQKDIDGCVFYEDADGSQENVRLTGSSEQTGNRHKCFSRKAYGCNTVQNGDGPASGRYWWKNIGKNDPSNPDASEHRDSDHGSMYAYNAKRGRWEMNPAQVAAAPSGQTYRMLLNGQSGRDGLIHATNRVTLKHLVNSLNTLGAVDLYYHRVQRNPIKGEGVALKWIAENACKVSMPVSFQCTGSDCVEIQNIVCASFTGIDSADYAVVSIECKVPPSKFVINSSKKTCKDSDNQFKDDDEGVLDGSTSNAPAGGRQGTAQCGRNYARANNKFKVSQDGGYMALGNAEFQFGQGPNQACSGGTCSITVKSKSKIPENGNYAGSVSIHADVKSLNQQPRKWSEKLNHFHTAEFNASRESAPVKVLEMPIGLNFYSDDCGQEDLQNPHPSGDNAKLCKGDTLRNTVKKVAALFPNGIDSVPFLSKQSVNLGQIKKLVHGYIRMVAKVQAKDTWFLSREVTALEVSEKGSDDSDFSEKKNNGQKYYDAKKCTNVDRRDADKDTATVRAGGYKGKTNSPYHTKQNFPVAYLSCPLLMRGMQAGWVMRLSLRWQLSSLHKNDAGRTGKAQLLQDAEEADPNAQSVEVQVTIQLGGGETNITTGTAEGAASADNTVTYIIIAVCVIAAALILAVVVVAFMCLRNRSQEQLVAMSPKQATVAAVYDISAPKKGDVMDV